MVHLLYNLRLAGIIIQIQILKQADSDVSDTNGFINFLTSAYSDTRRERHNSYNANYPQRAVHLVMFKISVDRDPKNPTTSSTVKIQLPTDSFSKSSNFQDYLLRAWLHPHYRTTSYLEFIMTMAIVISFARDCKTVPNDYAPEFLTRIVQSPTQVNDEI